MFVVSHSIPERLSKDNKDFIFVTDGIESALAQAKVAAGDKSVTVMGGANVIQQYIQAGLVDAIHIHIVPVLLNAGTRLFDHIGSESIELQPTRVIGITPYNPSAISGHQAALKLPMFLMTVSLSLLAAN